MYVKAINQVVEKYPYSIGGLRKDNPQVSFPNNPTDEMLASYNVFPVVGTSPNYDPATQVAEPNGCAFNGARWETSWTVRDKTAEEIVEDQQRIQDQIVQATQQRLDEFAQTKNYDGILSACTYATSPTAIFAAEGQYCVNQRDATWAKLYQILTEVQLGLRPMPTGYADIEAELPVLTWPAN
jgi:hypothetical protein